MELPYSPTRSPAAFCVQRSRLTFTSSKVSRKCRACNQVRKFAECFRYRKLCAMSLRWRNDASGKDKDPHDLSRDAQRRTEAAVAPDDDSDQTATDAVVGAAVRGGSLLMVLALLQRASTFVLNVLLQRAMLSGADGATTSPEGQHRRAASALEEYGAAAITLELISSTAIFLAREPFRVALARSRVPREAALPSDSTKHAQQRETQRQRFVNTAWLSAPIGAAFAAVVYFAYPRMIANDAFNTQERNRQAATLMCLAAAVELLCEPLALIFQHRLLVSVRGGLNARTSSGYSVLVTAFFVLVRAEASAVLVLGVARYYLVTRWQQGILSFGYAQLLHSLTLAAAYLFFVARDTRTARSRGAGGVLEDVAQEDEALVRQHQGFARPRDWLPRKPDGSTSVAAEGTGDEGGWVDSEQLCLAGALAGQSLLKHLLTEGDKIVLARATVIGPRNVRGAGGGGGGSLYEQGVYAIASGYGSLVARLLFQPLEEAARLMFSKLGAEDGIPSNGLEIHGTAGEADTDASRELPARARRPASAEERNNPCPGGDANLREKMAVLLATLLKLVLTAGLVFVSFGFHYTETLLRLLLAGSGGGGRKGSADIFEVARVLSWYCVYVLFLAANGMCEAFSCSVAKGKQLTRMGGGLVVSFAVFGALVGPLTTRFGTRGLVMANAAGMACRVLFSAAFIRRYFLRETLNPGSSTSVRTSPDAKHGRRGGLNLWRKVVRGALPHPVVLATLASSSMAVHVTSPSGCAAGDPCDVWNVASAAKHVAFGVACLCLSGSVFIWGERDFLRNVLGLWRARRSDRYFGSNAQVHSSAVSHSSHVVAKNADRHRKLD